MSAGNGHSSPAVIAANQRVEQCRKRLAPVDEKLTVLSAKLARAVEACTAAKAQLDAAEQAMAADTPGADKQWQTANTAHAAAAARVAALEKQVREQTRLRALPEAEYQQASAALSFAIQHEDLERARRAWATSNHRLRQLHDATLLEEQENYKLKKALGELEAAARAATQRESAAPRTVPQYGYYNPGPNG